MKTRGNYKHDYPLGCVIHYSAGDDITSSMEWGRLNGFSFFGINQDGIVIQSVPLNEWGYHAGISYHPEFGDNLSSKLVGIELTCNGKLEKKNGEFYTWYNRIVPKENVRTCDEKDNIQMGYYEKYTTKQELALEALILWLYDNNPFTFNLANVFGHDEICIPKGRKTDPGGCLSMTMTQYRTYLKNKRQK